MRSIPGFSRYMATEDGQIIKVRDGLPMRQHKMNAGYLMVPARGDGKPPGGGALVHRLVCIAFHGEPPTPKHTVDHIDGDKTNNRASNLRWATRHENMWNPVTAGRIKRGAAHYAAKLSDEDVAAIREARARGEKLKTIASRYGIAFQSVSEICLGKSRRVMTSASHTLRADELSPP